MKKITKALLIIAILISAMISLTGCGNAKNETKAEQQKGTQSNTIVGTWKYQGADYTYHFNEDGTGDYSFANSKMEFTYTTDENKISILYKGNTAPFETEFSIDGDTLNVKDSLGNDTLYKKQ